ncbi:MAG TPA: CcoQ/FixQ family Cbb3-type cytochrome c oxidase assembly chaperone [Campylobacterales bacterium]|nr:CcoQ/FixQ family Cbb3-type cytochrome c oxidase assembly chaperone [Campylobacterales bacterium]
MAMDIGLVQAYAYFFTTALLTFLMCAYGYHIYTSKKKEGKDYERYSDMVLHDGIYDAPVEKLNSAKS